MQVQRTIQTVDSPHLAIEVPASFVHRQVEILVITLDETDSQPTRKRRVPPPQFAGRVKELGDVMSSVSADDWGQNK
jgi:hypothetical protein